MRWYRALRMRYWRWMFRRGYRPALMSLDMRGRLTTNHTPRKILLGHFAKEVVAARRLGELLRAEQPIPYRLTDAGRALLEGKK